MRALIYFIDIYGDFLRRSIRQASGPTSIKSTDEDEQVILFEIPVSIWVF